MDCKDTQISKNEYDECAALFLIFFWLHTFLVKKVIFRRYDSSKHIFCNLNGTETPIWIWYESFESILYLYSSKTCFCVFGLVFKNTFFSLKNKFSPLCAHIIGMNTVRTTQYILVHRQCNLYESANFLHIKKIKPVNSLT